MTQTLPPTREAGEPAAEPARLVTSPKRILLVSILVSVVPAVIVGLLVWRGGISDTAGGRAPAAATHAAIPIYLRLFLAVLLIGGLAHAGGWLAARLRQPRVVGEIVAGLLLGPSVLGRFLPEVSTALFPADIRADLNVLAQIALILFMFSVGAEMDLRMMRRQGAAIGMISQATMIAPFLLGLLLVPTLYPDFAGEGVGMVPFAIFMGTAISITAFPVLARIVQDSGLSGTRLGNLAMICAGINDVMAWCALAVVIAVIQAGSALGALVALPLAIAVSAFALLVLKPLLQRAADRLDAVQASLAVRIVAVLCLVFALAGLTDQIGVHAIFGAFLAGLILPRKSRFLAAVPERLSTLNRALLLPVFFASIGLQVDVVSAIGHTSVLLAGLLILVVAVGGKLLSAAFCARAGGMPWRESLGLGVLLNARGITEIVVLRTGMDIGVINTKAFTVMVVMALTTTIMAAPLLRLLRVSRPAGPSEAIEPDGGDDSPATIKEKVSL
ncbi:cation:proton antiporter [Actinoplanes awajinensis]|uniref:Cation/H+ exchanger transmembrane domain-containing protein n=1 Tax=Actinoplanes awajinensis subsp. mycoplanecinus TaxID=135947 RepID=A0A0X3UPX5_9ACTN|nr:cation:proton antiporter [Actinoplanes awajinensis]KUL34520.1 hypothetical protein ADL15_15700 [Actinoplanes awajinensis subsp. mycoplanecinus]